MEALDVVQFSTFEKSQVFLHGFPLTMFLCVRYPRTICAVNPTIVIMIHSASHRILVHTYAYAVTLHHVSFLLLDQECCRHHVHAPNIHRHSYRFLQVWKLLAAILHVSNLTFGEAGTDGGQAGSKLTSDPSNVCAMLGVNEAELEEVLTVRKVNTSRESVATSVSKDTAESAARGMSKALYSRLFSWVVARVNQSIQVCSLHNFFFFFFCGLYCFPSSIALPFKFWVL